ncbi:MAG: TIR domain-containing protein [Chloroflexia bacterium]
MPSNKVVFVAFAIEDESQRNLLKGQSLYTKSPFEYVDMSVKEPYDSNWKDRVRTRIRRSDGVIALVSENTLTSSGEQWEISCAQEEGVSLIGLWVYSNDRTRPNALNGTRIIEWTWQGIADFIDSL